MEPETYAIGFRRAKLVENDTDSLLLHPLVANIQGKRGGGKVGLCRSAMMIDDARLLRRDSTEVSRTRRAANKRLV